MRGATVHLGFEVGSGKPVEIPLRHMVVTGQTQEAGKTTTLEALIHRAGLPAVAFVTKRGEQSFAGARRIQPYFRERADWQFVASVLEATMRERLKFERAWIIRASKGAKTLADVQRNVRALMEKAKGLSADVYMTLDSYLEIVVPRVAGVRFAEKLDLAPGLNVLHLEDRDRFPPELQALVMRSVLEWVYERCNGTITLIPEAWEFLPQGRGSPVKLSAVELIRKGAGLRNYVWLDSQDIGGIDKELLRSCPVWLLGVQREANEIKRVLENIPAGIAKPKAADVARLRTGQFFACYSDHVINTYVQPAWMSDDDAIKVARMNVELYPPRPPAAPPIQEPEEDDDFMSASAEKKLDKIIELLEQVLTQPRQEIITGKPDVSIMRPGGTYEPVSAPIADEDALYQRFKDRLTKEAPAILQILVTKPEIRIEWVRETIQVDLKSARGMVAKILQEGFFDQGVTANVVWKELQRRWDYGGNSARVYEQCNQLTALGFLTKEADGYKAVPDMKSNIVRA